jgi:hypothetical protein
MKLDDDTRRGLHAGSVLFDDRVGRQPAFCAHCRRPIRPPAAATDWFQERWWRSCLATGSRARPHLSSSRRAAAAQAVDNGVVLPHDAAASTADREALSPEVCEVDSHSDWLRGLIARRRLVNGGAVGVDALAERLHLVGEEA